MRSVLPQSLQANPSAFLTWYAHFERLFSSILFLSKFSSCGTGFDSPQSQQLKRYWIESFAHTILV
jgi:hypothetical protein